MYRVKIYDGPDDNQGLVIHSPKSNLVKLDNGVVKKEVSKIESFEFAFSMFNPGYGKIKPFNTLVTVFNTVDKEYEFEGRALIPTDSMAESGEFSTSFLCESELAYLHDAPQKHLEYRGNLYDLLEIQLDYYNSQVEPYKRFYIGNVTVRDPNDNVYTYLNPEESTFDSINRTLIDRYGGELQIRKENGIRYLDYLVQIGHESPVKIELSKNLLSISRKVDPTNIVSRLTPLGAKLEEKNGVVDSFDFLGDGTKVARVEIENQNNLIDIPFSLLPPNTNVGSFLNVYGEAPNYIVTSSNDQGATDAAQPRLSIESVNNGLPYIDRQDLIEEFGIQGGSQIFEDVNSAALVKAKGKDWLNSQKLVLYQYSVDAIDLSKIGLDIKSFKAGNSHLVKNDVMKIDDKIRIISKLIDITVPERDALTIGDKFKNANDYQSDMNKSNAKVADLDNTIKRQATAIGGLKKTIKEVNDTIVVINKQIEESDLPGLNNAIYDLSTVVDELTIQIGNIPSYELATTSSDGLMSKTDKSKLDNLQNYDVATTTQDGLMSASDKNAIGFIGEVSSLSTDAKTDLVSAINELATKINDLKEV